MKKIQLVAIALISISLTSCTLFQSGLAFPEYSSFFKNSKINSGRIKKESNDLNYYITDDGAKILCSEIVDDAIGELISPHIKADKVKYATRKVKYYCKDGTLHIRISKRSYAREIVGCDKLRIFECQKEIAGYTTTNSYGNASTNSYHKARTTYTYYAEKDKNGKPLKINTTNNLSKIISDCPLAFDMLNQSKSQIKKNIKDAKTTLADYVETAVNIYNNDCKSIENK